MIVIELAKYFGVDPDVMMDKPIPHLFWLKAKAYQYAEIEAKARRDARED